MAKTTADVWFERYLLAHGYEPGEHEQDLRLEVPGLGLSSRARLCGRCCRGPPYGLGLLALRLGSLRSRRFDQRIPGLAGVQQQLFRQRGGGVDEREELPKIHHACCSAKATSSGSDVVRNWSFSPPSALGQRPIGSRL